MTRALAIAAVAEIATGVALLLLPSLVAQLLFGAELAGAGLALARVTGIALIALGVACWPGTPLRGMLIYSVGATLYLVYVGLTATASGVLLWPAVAAHLVLAVLLARAGASDKATKA